MIYKEIKNWLFGMILPSVYFDSTSILKMLIKGKFLLAGWHGQTLFVRVILAQC